MQAHRQRLALVAVAGWVAVTGAALVAPFRSCSAWHHGYVVPAMIVGGLLGAAAVWLVADRQARITAVVIAVPVGLSAAAAIFLAMAIGALLNCAS